MSEIIDLDPNKLQAEGRQQLLHCLQAFLDQLTQLVEQQTSALEQTSGPRQTFGGFNLYRKNAAGQWTVACLEAQDPEAPEKARLMHLLIAMLHLWRQAPEQSAAWASRHSMQLQVAACGTW